MLFSSDNWNIITFINLHKGILFLLISPPKPQHQHQEEKQISRKYCCSSQHLLWFFWVSGEGDQMPPLVVDVIYGEWGTWGFTLGPVWYISFGNTNSRAWEAPWSLQIRWSASTYLGAILPLHLPWFLPWMWESGMTFPSTWVYSLLYASFMVSKNVR